MVRALSRRERFHSPFDEGEPPPLARAAAESLQAELREGLIAPGVPTSLLEGPDGGKMFGVLVARSEDGALHTLRAFSGMLAGRWQLEGFVPPLFDAAARQALEPDGEARVKALHARCEALRCCPERAALEEQVAAASVARAGELAALRAVHEGRRRLRRARREQGAADAARLLALDQESRADKAELRRLKASHAAQAQREEEALDRLGRRLRAAERLRQVVSRELMKRLHDTYRVRNALGEVRGLRELFPHGEPPSGAGDCAAPKLLSAAYARGLWPVAMAEFWWGAPPSTGGRLAGVFYPACRLKCGPLLPFMLAGVEVAPARRFTLPPPPADLVEVLFEDDSVVVLHKPRGLLSVPPREAAAADSVLAWLRRRYPLAKGPLLVHRLDLDTSGLLVAALDERAHAALQRQFLERTVHKRYVALVEGCIPQDGGLIDLPIRVDVEDRPRQIHDPIHGKRALTQWHVLDRSPAVTRLALSPLTGRTHQLRVHAAHPRGLAAPIVGDRLYGHPGERLMLHAEGLSFLHPVTGLAVRFSRPAPF